MRLDPLGLRRLPIGRIHGRCRTRILGLKRCDYGNAVFAE